MKESIGNAFVVNLIIAFLFLFLLFFATSLSYTKAFKVKNRIMNILEKHGDVVSTMGSLTSDVKSEIDQNLGDMGYRISNKTGCTSRFPNAQIIYNSSASDYRYCIQMYDSGDRGKYYGVTAYMYFEIPLIGRVLEFPVYGETKVMGLLG